MKISRKFRKTALLLALGAAFTTAPQPASAQWLTTDIPHIGVQLAEFAKKAQDWWDTIQHYQVVKDAYNVATVAKDISGKIRDISDQVRSLTADGLAFQQQIQADLRKVQAIRNLRISNMTDVKNIASNLTALSLANLLPSLGQSPRFTAALASATDRDAGIIKEEFNTVSTTSGTRRNVLEANGQQAQAAVTMVAVETNAQEEKIATAFRYKRTADELTAQAIELQAGTNTDGKFTMSDGERLLVQSQAAANLVQAQELRQKAEELLAAAARKGPAQQATEQVMYEQNTVAGLQGILKEQMPNF